MIALPGYCIISLNFSGLMPFSERIILWIIEGETAGIILSPFSKTSMKNPFETLLFSIALIYIVHSIFIIWRTPEQYKKRIHSRREELEKRFPFLPNWLTGFVFYFEEPRLLIGSAKIGLSIAFVICVVGLLAGIFGSF